MKKFILLIVLLLVGAGMAWRTFVQSNHSVPPPQPLRFALDSWPGDAHAFLADKKGIFAKNGVIVQLKMEKGPADSLVSYKNGDVDGVIGAVYSDAILLQSMGFPSKVIYVSDYSENGDVIIGRPELASLADLKGHTVSFERLNSFSHIFVLKALESQGLNEATIKFELVEAPNVLQALEEGRIDAGHTWQPTSSKALAKGYKVLAKAGDFPGVITDTVLVRAKIAVERPREVQAFVRSMIEARLYAADHKEESLTIMAKGAGMSREEMASGLAEIWQANLQDNLTAFTQTDSPRSLHQSGDFIIKFFLKRGVLRTVPKLEELLDNRFVQAIQKEK